MSLLDDNHIRKSSPPLREAFEEARFRGMVEGKLEKQEQLLRAVLEKLEEIARKLERDAV